MALKTNNSALAIGIQSLVDTFSTPAQPAALMPCSSLKMDIQGVTIANNEYTGSPIKNGDVIAGKRVQVSYQIKLRGPGGSVPPVANSFLIGLILQAAKFTEVRTATAIPAVPEALGAGSTTTAAKLGATAAATVDLYKGMALLLGAGTYKQSLTQIRTNDATKLATLPETLPGAPTGNYQIPAQIGYMRSITSTDPIWISQSVWIGGIRYDLMNCRLSQLQIVVPTSTRATAAFPEMSVTWDCILNAYADDTTPAIPALGAIPLYRDGDCWLANTKVGTQTFTVDLGVTSESPPDPNKADGSGAPEFVASVGKVNMTRQKYTVATLDTIVLAQAQTYYSFWAQYGSGVPGGMVQIFVPDARVNYQNNDTSGALVHEQGDIVVDALDRGIVINFPY